MSSRSDSNHARARVLRVSSRSLLIETSDLPFRSMAAEPSPAGMPHTIADERCDACSNGREKIAAELFFAIVSGNVVHVGDRGVRCRTPACVGTWQAEGDDKRQASDAGEGQRLGACTVSHPPRAFGHQRGVTASARADVDLSDCLAHRHCRCHRHIERAQAFPHRNDQPCVGGLVHLVARARRIRGRTAGRRRAETRGRGRTMRARVVNRISRADAPLRQASNASQLG